MRYNKANSGFLSVKAVYTGKRDYAMPTEAYLEAKKEFVNCLWMTIFGLGVPLVIAFKEWWPIMQAEKKKMRESQKTSA